MKKILVLLPVVLFAVSCATHRQHNQAHNHSHQPRCGHIAVLHEGHVDYLHDGHLHQSHGSHVDEHAISATASNPNQCAPVSTKNEHAHNSKCGHAAVPHAGHLDYLVEGHLHHAHNSHCDDHGTLALK